MTAELGTILGLNAIVSSVGQWDLPGAWGGLKGG